MLTGPTDIGVPGPSTLDMGRAFRSVRRDPLTFLTAMTERYGDTVAFPVPGPPALFLGDPDDIKHVLQTSARNWSKRTVQYAALARVTGPGLLASAEPTWMDHRRLAAPAFHHQRLDAVSAQVAAAARDVLADALGGLPGGGAVLDVSPVMHRIGLDAVGRALFSSDLSTQAEGLLQSTGAAAGLVVRLGRSVLPLARLAPTPTNLRLRQVSRRLDCSVNEVLAERRRSLTRDGEAKDGGSDLLTLLIESGMDEPQIRDELVTMVLAGHETVAAALSWTLMLLAEHDDVQDRVRDELATLGRPPSMTTPRSDLAFTRAVLDESLRLFPPAWAISRRSTAPDVIAGREVPVGTLAIISPWVTHRREHIWPDPLAFRPERFISGRTTIPGYLPFGQGPRLCIGREFALGEMVLVIDELLTNHRLSLPPGWSRPQPDTQVAVHPAGGMPLRITPLSGDPYG